MAGGRPRAFDVDEALDRALEVSGARLRARRCRISPRRWDQPAQPVRHVRHKQALFRKCRPGAHGPAAYAARALELPRARDVVGRSSGAIELTTGPDTPLGCINVRGPGLRTGSRSCRHEAMTRRAADHAACGAASAGPRPRATCCPAPTRPSPVRHHVHRRHRRPGQRRGKPCTATARRRYRPARVASTRSRRRTLTHRSEPGALLRLN
jgi:hypothetical protein